MIYSPGEINEELIGQKVLETKMRILVWMNYKIITVSFLMFILLDFDIVCSRH